MVQSEAAGAPYALSIAAAFATMGDKRRVKRTFWPTHIYDYNYKVSEGYYKPQKDFMTTSSLERTRYSPPKHSSYAERFASNPWYGNTRGLPYKSNVAALNEPLIKPSERYQRSSSLLREMKDQEEMDIPFHIRANRRRRKYEEEDLERGIRSRPPRPFSHDSNDKYRLHPRFKDVGDKLRSLDAEIARLAPRRASVTKDSYTSPSGTSVHKSSRTEVSHYDSSSSKPPFSPRARKISLNDEFFQPTPRPRGRISSVGELSDLPRRSSITDDEDALMKHYANRADKMREERRGKESREITENIHGMVEKMRAHRLDTEDGYLSRKDRGTRPSALDPHLTEDKKIHSSFSYHVIGKH